MADGTLPRTDGVEYRIIEGYPDYAVGDDGSVWSKKRKHWTRMKPTINTAGYYVVTLGSRPRKQYKVHRIVAASFIGSCPVGLVVNHIDGVKRNNCPSNLEYVTLGENNSHASRIGLSRQNEGELNHRSKLTDEQVRELVSALQHGELQSSIANRFGISQSCVSKYRLGKRRASCGAAMGRDLSVPEHRGGDKNYRKGRR